MQKPIEKVNEDPNKVLTKEEIDFLLDSLQEQLDKLQEKNKME